MNYIFKEFVRLLNVFSFVELIKSKTLYLHQNNNLLYTFVKM